jgi:hypothetical protein
VLRDFSLLHPIKVMEALDPEAFEKEEVILEQQLMLQREHEKGKAMQSFAQNFSKSFTPMKTVKFLAPKK